MSPNNSSPSKAESLASLAVLATLATIAAVILAIQSENHPALISPDAALSASSEPAAAPTKALVDLPAGLSPLTPPEDFGPETLSDKIDGKAELYLSAGFVGLQSQRFKDVDNPDRWMEAFVFDMGSPENAFAVFSSQQRSDGVPSDIARYAYRTANAFYWVNGPYYVELIASEASEAALQQLQQVAAAFLKESAVPEAQIAETAIFPSEGLESGSIVLIPSDAFGYERLDKVYTAQYLLEGSELTAFVSRRNDPESASTLALDYRNFLASYGGRVLDAGETGVIVLEILGSYEVIFQQGPYLAGVHEAEAQEPALQLARALKESIRNEIDKK